VTGLVTALVALTSAVSVLPGGVRSVASAATSPAACNTPVAGSPGIASGNSLVFGGDVSGALNGMQALGTRWLRLDVTWSYIQMGGPTSYDWSLDDPPITGAIARGINVDGNLAYTPWWAQPPGVSDDHYPPPNPADFANFAAAAVRHYAPMGVHTWEIWNEPNNPAFWKPAPNVAQYAAMLVQAYDAIKSVDPGATVLTGGTDLEQTTSTSVSAVDFLSGLYANGAGGHFDAVAHHPYTWPNTPNNGDLASAWSEMADASPSLRSVMNANGDANKQIWATEYGAPTNEVSEAQQAAEIAQAYVTFESYPWAGPMFVYSYQDLGTDTTNDDDFFGLLRFDGSRKPSWSAFQAAAAAFTADCSGGPGPPCTTFSSSATGSHVVCGAIRAKYLALGGPTGFLGYPTTDETLASDSVGRYNNFANGGSIYWSPSTGAWEVHGAIGAKYAALGGPTGFLGYPTSDETGTGDNVGRYNNFANGGSIYWTPSTGAQSIHGAIRAKYLALGGPTAFLGYPVTDETGTPDGIGRYNHFANSGSIYWTPSTGAWSIHGAIRAKWASMGWERSILGYPVTDESGARDGVGRYNHFANYGSIYWTPSTGPWSIHGAIRAKYLALGGPMSFLRYPTTDETGTPDGVGRYNHFSSSDGWGASIYWTPSTGPWSIHGAIRALWASMGWETSCLGYPVSDEYGISGGRESDLQGGSITFMFATGQATSSC
jgi:hypothetical protein